jgi:hypothetical protein
VSSILKHFSLQSHICPIIMHFTVPNTNFYLAMNSSHSITKIGKRLLDPPPNISLLHSQQYTCLLILVGCVLYGVQPRLVSHDSSECGNVDIMLFALYTCHLSHHHGGTTIFLLHFVCASPKIHAQQELPLNQKDVIIIYVH